LPVLMLLMDYWPLQRTDLKLKNIKNFVFEKWPFFVFAIVSAVITYISQTQTAFTALPSQYRHGVVPMILCHNIIFYLYKIIWPVNLSSHYPYPAPMSFSNPVILAAAIGTFVLIALLLISLRWTRAAMTGWLFFFVGIFPTMGIIGFTNTIASDKFAYLPSVGLLMILAVFLKWLWSVSDIGKFTRQSIGLAIIVLAMVRAEAIATRQYLVHWQDSMSLCKHILKLAPNEASSYNLIGFTLQSEGKYDDAANCYRQAILFNPNEADAYNNLSVILISQGKINEAVDCLNKSLQIYPNSAEAYNNLSVLFKLQGKFNEAVDCLRRALQINPDYADGLSNLGIVLGMQGKSEEAIDCYRKAIKLKPDDAKVYNNLAWLLVTDSNPKIRNPAQAVEFAERAVELTKHQSAVILNTLAETYAAAGRFDKAIITAQETLAIASAAQNKELADYVRKQLELYKQSKR